MAGGFHKLGIGIMLKLSGRGYIDEMGRARDSTGKFVKTLDLLPPGFKQAAMASQMLEVRLKRLKRGFNMIGSGIQNLGMAALPISAGLGLAAKQAATFEKEMKGVEAVTDYTVEQYGNLGKLAKEIGIETQYDPQQAASLMEGMGKAGATYEETMGGAMGIASAAAAEQMDLAKAQSIVTQTARVMGISLSEASRIADSYAKLSANANTNIQELGEAFKYAGPSARKMGMDMDETLAFLSKLGDAGLKGSIGGTAMQNMMNKITRRSKKAQAAMETFGVSMTDQNKKFRPMTDILGDVVKGLGSMEDEEKRAAIVTELFGIRGERAYLAFSTQGKKSFEDMINMSRQASNELDKDGKKVGAAYIMAQKRLEGFAGRLTKLRGSLATFAIEAGVEMNLLFGKIADDGLNAFNRLLKAMMALSEFDGEAKAREMFGDTAVEIVLGFTDALDEVKNAIQKVIDKMKELGGTLSEYLGEDGVRKLTKFITLATVILGAMGPIALAMWPINMALGGILSIAKGLALVLTSAFWPVTIGLLILGGIFAALKQDTETWGEAATRIFGEVKDTIMKVYEVALKPFIDGFTDFLGPAIEDIGAAFRSLGESVSKLFGTIFDYIDMTDDQTSSTFYGIGGMIVTVLSLAIQGITYVIKGIIELINFLLTPIRFLLENVKRVAAAFGTMAGGQVLQGFKRLGLSLLDNILYPLRSIGSLIIKLADAVGFEIPQSIRTFVDKGLYDMVYGGETGSGGPGKKKVKIVDPKQQAKEQVDSMAKIMRSREAEKKDAIAEGFKMGMDAYSPHGFAVKADIKNQMCVDGEGLNVASARSKTEVKERMGTKFSPYQHRVMMEHGAETT